MHNKPAVSMVTNYFHASIVSINSFCVSIMKVMLISYVRFLQIFHFAHKLCASVIGTFVCLFMHLRGMLVGKLKETSRRFLDFPI